MPVINGNLTFNQFFRRSQIIKLEADAKLESAGLAQAKQHQELIRRAVGLLEQMTANNQKLHQTALLGDYIDAFCNTYQERMEEEETTSMDLLTHLALKLLINLLFYSAPGGHRRLWLALIDLSTK